MFWTIVGALLFVFVGIPFLLLALICFLLFLLYPLASVADYVVATLPKKITWRITARILSSVVGFILVLSQLFLDFYGEKRDDWVTVGLLYFGIFLFFLGIVGSFSPKKWKDFWKNNMIIKLDRTKVDERGGYQKCSVYKKDNIFIFEVWDAQKVDGKSSRGKRKVHEEYENEQDAILAYESWKKARE